MTHVSSRPGRQIAAAEGLRRRLLPVDAAVLRAEGDAQLSAREGPAQPALPRRACAAPLSQRRGALHRLQAVRGDLPGAGDHHRGRPAPQRRHAPHRALRHRHGEVHLLRLLPGSLPGRRHRRGAEFRVRDRDARGALLRQGQAARQRRPLGARDRAQHRSGRAVSDETFANAWTGERRRSSKEHAASACRRRRRSQACRATNARRRG